MRSRKTKTLNALQTRHDKASLMLQNDLYELLAVVNTGNHMFTKEEADRLITGFNTIKFRLEDGVSLIDEINEEIGIRTY